MTKHNYSFEDTDQHGYSTAQFVDRNKIGKSYDASDVEDILNEYEELKARQDECDHERTRYNGANTSFNIVNNANCPKCGADLKKGANHG